MTPHELRDLEARLAASAEATPVGEAAERPVRDYVDPARHEQELRSVFRRAPLILGPSSSLLPGQVQPTEVCGVSVLAVRDRDGTFRAFVNACRHRGVRLAEAKTTCRVLVCPYHGWSYGLNGALGEVPGLERFPGLDRAQSGLVPLPAEEAGELLWVGLTPGTQWLSMASVERWLGDLQGWLSGHRLFRRSRLDWDCNWKLPLLSVLEGYPARHTPKDAGVARAVDRGGHSSRVVEPLRGDRAAGPLRSWASVTYQLFPNAIVQVHEDCVSLLQTWPLTANRSTWTHQLLVPAGESDPATLARWAQVWDELEERGYQAQDLPLCEAAQSGLQSGAFPTHALSDADEVAVGFLQDVASQASRP